MLPFSIAIISGLVSGLFAWRPTIATSAAHWLQGVYYYGRIRQIRATNAVMRFIQHFIIILAVLIGLFVLTLNLPGPIFGVSPKVMTIAVLLLAVALTYVSMYVLYATSLTLDEARKQLKPLQRLLRRVPLVFKIPASVQALTGFWGVLLKGVVSLPLGLFNAIWLLISVPLLATGGIIRTLLRLMATAAKLTRWLSRLWALVNLYLIALLGAFVLDHQTDLGVMDGTTVLIVVVFITSFLSFSHIMDWRIPMRGGFWTATLGFALTSILFILILGIHVSPPLARTTVGRIVKNGHDQLKTRLNKKGLRGTESKYAKVKAAKPLTGEDLYTREQETDGSYSFVPLGGTNPKAVVVKENDLGVVVSQQMEADNDLPTVMIEVYFPDDSDKRMLQLKKRTNRHFWVAKEDIPEEYTAEENNNASTTGPSVQVYANKAWQKSGITLKPGQTISFNATGNVCWDPKLPCVGPEGTTFQASDMSLPGQFPVTNATCGTLIARIDGEVHIVGSGTIITSPTGGEVEFMINDRWLALGDNSGSFNVSYAFR